MLKRLLLLSLLPLCSHAEELPAPVKAIEKQGITIIKPFEAPGGMKGWLGKYQGENHQGGNISMNNDRSTNCPSSLLVAFTLNVYCPGGSFAYDIF